MFERLNIGTVLDAPCGDWNWMRHVDLSRVNYVGVDVVLQVIESHNRMFTTKGVQFLRADIAQDTLPKADLIICRDCWVHLSFRDIAAVLENFRRS
ncbi:MAG: class I SAM-dependent methyltransferase, partial [Vicinamibacterales bacterium]